MVGRPAQITDKADSKVGFLHFQAIIAKKLEVGEGLSYDRLENCLRMFAYNRD